MRTSTRPLSSVTTTSPVGDVVNTYTSSDGVADMAPVSTSTAMSWSCPWRSSRVEFAVDQTGCIQSRSARCGIEEHVSAVDGDEYALVQDVQDAEARSGAAVRSDGGRPQLLAGSRVERCDTPAVALAGGHDRR